MTREELKARLQEVADGRRWEIDDDTTVEDFAGGNVDDAFDGGVDTGRSDMAREVLKYLDDLTCP